VGLTGSSISSSNPSILSLSFAIAIDSCFNLLYRVRYIYSTWEGRVRYNT
jgi:hypothetical protein